MHEMIQLWMAEGYLQTADQTNMETVGNKLFSLLVQSSLLQVWRRDSYGNIEHFGMHDLVHDLALSILSPRFLDNTYQCRYISRPFRDESSPISKEHAKSLRALLFNANASQIMLSNFQCLHVLILIGEDVNELPIEIGKLICLRYLDISHTEIECLPDSIGHLYNLETLRATEEYGGESCLRKPPCLRKLPDTFKLLTSLRHLYIPNIKLPPGIGKLISLQTLLYFEVGDEESCGIMELKNLNNLKGKIEIHNLEKIRDKKVAKSASLFNKPNIQKLKLVWNEYREDGINDENVLEGLQPHPNLKSIEIKGYRGKSFPLWTLRMEVREDLDDRWIRLNNLLEITLSDCKECEEIPMLGHLPRLKSLYLCCLSKVRSMSSSFYGIKRSEVNTEKNIVVFPMLEKLELIDMTSLTSWTEAYEDQPREVFMFCRLEYLKIVNCSQLMSAPSHFPCLRELKIYNMESGLPLANICGYKLTTLTKLIISEVDGLVFLPDELFNNNRDLIELHISSCNYLTHLAPRLGGGGVSLRKLEIVNCLSFKELPQDLHNLNALEKLRIWHCPNLKSIAYPSESERQLSSSLRHLEFLKCSGLTNLPCEMLESCALSLQRLWLTGSESLTNLPQVMSTLHKMPRLTNLRIKDVPKLGEVTAEIGSLRSLEQLVIGGCSDCWDYVSIKASLDRIFRALRSLRVLTLHGVAHWEGLPDQLQHLTTLHELYLIDFGIQELLEWLERLSSLKTLQLVNCQKLRSVPSKKAMQGLTKLNNLYINRCPILKKNLKQEGSDDSERSKVSHIARITVDWQPFSAHAK